jgi:hypothetical protein
MTRACPRAGETFDEPLQTNLPSLETSAVAGLFAKNFVNKLVLSVLKKDVLLLLSLQLLISWRGE